MKKIHVVLGDDMYQDLKKIVDYSGGAIAERVRIALSEHIKSERKSLAEMKRLELQKEKLALRSLGEPTVTKPEERKYGPDEENW